LKKGNDSRSIEVVRSVEIIPVAHNSVAMSELLENGGAILTERRRFLFAEKIKSDGKGKEGQCYLF
jgi:hypothetical protein